MKNAKYIIAIVMVVMLIPCTVFFSNGESGQAQSASSSDDSEKSADYSNEDLTFLLYHHDTGEVTEVSSIDYIKGVVAAEMPSSFEEEALKAQAVAAHTYAIRRYLQAVENPNEDLKGAQLSTDPSTFQAYASQEQLMETYGDSFDEKWQKISDAVDSVRDIVITYDSDLIVAAYHSLSAGITETAKTVWGYDVPYLQAADSQTDTQQESYINTVTYTKQEVQEILEKNSCVLSENPEEWITIESYTDSGYVNQVLIDNQFFTGVQIRTLFQLKSADFEISYAEEVFTFTTKGYGHGVGMSQYGANELAKQGYSYDEILTHYYSGVTLSKINELNLFD